MIHARSLFALVILSLASIGAPLRLAHAAGVPDAEHGSFGPCVGAHRITCVVDGDTIWYRGEKVRVADVNAPELSHPACPAEADLAAAATVRLTVLLNAGAFSLAPWPARRIDRYGRSLYVITRAGRSLGQMLVSEGLAERWKGYRSNWC
jgi:micrococcal nuclease